MSITENIISALYAMSHIEAIAVLLAIVYVILAARESIWCWPPGIISSALYFVMCIQINYQLEAILQLYYVGMGVYGWIYWNKKSAQKNIQSKNWRWHLNLIGAGGLLCIFFGFVFTQTGSSLPYLDAFTTTFAIIATWLVAKKVLENWLYWIVIDLISIYLYGVKGFWLTSALFIVYTSVAIVGYFNWLKKHGKLIKAS